LRYRFPNVSSPHHGPREECTRKNKLSSFRTPFLLKGFPLFPSPSPPTQRTLPPDKARLPQPALFPLVIKTPSLDRGSPQQNIPRRPRPGPSADTSPEETVLPDFWRALGKMSSPSPDDPIAQLRIRPGLKPCRDPSTPPRFSPNKMRTATKFQDLSHPARSVALGSSPRFPACHLSD